MGLIRFLLALIVAGDHFTVINLGKLNLTSNGIQQWIYMNAGFAVMFFYTISGFLISYTIENKYASIASGTLIFYKNRFIRIFSLYWPLMLISFWVFGSYGIQPTFKNIFVNVFIFGGDWIRGFANYPSEENPFHPLLGQVWSVSAELMFYIIAPIIFSNLRTSVCLAVFSFITRLTLEYIFNFNQAWDYHFLPSSICFFIIGHLARQLFKNEFFLKYTVGLIFLGLSCLAIAGTKKGGFVSPWFYFSIISFAFSLPSIFELSKDNKWLNFLGDLSYPIYLVHIWTIWQFTPIGVIDIMNLFNRGFPLYFIVVIYLIFTIFIAVVLHLLIEIPCVKALRYVLFLNRSKD